MFVIVACCCASCVPNMFTTKSGTFRNPQPLVVSQKNRRTNGRRGTNRRRTAVLEAHCGVSLPSRLRSQQGTALQMGGVLQYKLEVYCQYLSDKLYGLGVLEQCPYNSESLFLGIYLSFFY